MLSKLFFVVALFLGLAFEVQAHAIINPALGVTGTPARANVKRPSTQNPCGAGVNVATALASSKAVTADATGKFTVTVQNFNGGRDGSRQVTAKVDTTGKGTAFTQAATIITNGDLAPTAVGSQQVQAQLPAGTTCTGGKCLVSFTTAGKFGNCVVVQTGAAAATGAAAGTAAAGTAAAGTAATTGKKAAKAPRAVVYGARLARAFRHAVDEWM